MLVEVSCENFHPSKHLNLVHGPLVEEGLNGPPNPIKRRGCIDEEKSPVSLRIMRLVCAARRRRQRTVAECEAGAGSGEAYSVPPRLLRGTTPALS